MSRNWLPILLLALGSYAHAESAPAPAPTALEKVSPQKRIQKALYTPLDSFDDKEHSLTEMLQLFSKLTNENFVLDPGLPAGTSDTKLSIRVQKGSTVLDAFSVTLALSGLRYIVADNMIWVSSEDRLSRRLLNNASILEGTDTRAPFSTAEAVTRSQPFDRYTDDFIGAENFISNYPWRQWEAPRYNAATGLTDYPGPPVMMDSPDVGHPRFKYSTQPYFLKPEYIEIERAKQESINAEDRRQRAQREDNSAALAALLQLMKDNPNLTAKDLLDKMGKSK
jgi:hypothetical protein